MHYRIISERDKIEILGAFRLAYIARPFDEEVVPEGRSDTKFRIMVENHGMCEEVVLTIYETPDVHINGRDPFYSEVSTRYAAHVAQKLVSCQDREGAPVNAAVPSPYHTMDTERPFIRRSFDGVEKVVAITPFIAKAKEKMDVIDTEQAGRSLAAMHVAAEDFTGITLPSNFGPGHFRTVYQALQDQRESVVAKLSANLGMSMQQAALFLERTGDLLKRIMTKWEAVSPNLTTGWINGDYFPDNVLTSRDGKFVTVDLGMVCQDKLLYDLAIGMNAWSFSGHECDRAAAATFLAGYHSVKELTPPELEALPIAAAVAGLRWTMSRMGKVMRDFPTRSPVDALNQALFWEMFLDQGRRIHLSACYSSDDLRDLVLA